MKKDTAIVKKLLVVAIILAVITVSVIAFLGVYVKDLNKMSNIIPNYTFGTEFTGSREYQFSLDTTVNDKEMYIDKNGNIKGEVKKDSEESGVQVTLDDSSTQAENDETNIEGYTKETRTIKANEDNVLTPDNYKKSKAIIEKRLEKLGASEYNIRLDEVTGNLVVELPDNDDITFLAEAIRTQGKFSIIDYQNGLQLMDNSNIKNATVGYNGENGAYSVYLQLQFNKEGTEILKNMSNEYREKDVPVEEDNTENGDEATDSTETTDTTETSENTEQTENSSEEDTPKTEKKTFYVELKLDDQSLKQTYFSEEISGGIIQIPIASGITDQKTLKNSLRSSSVVATILNTGSLPNKYSLENDDYIKSTISDKNINTIKIIFASVIILVSLILIIRFGLNGLIGAILNLGYLGLVSLAMRYTNVVVTISSIVTAFLVIGINFAFMYILLKELKNDKKTNKNYNEAMKKLYLALIPICIVAFVFSFAQNNIITGIGMILFWGLIIQVLYNLIFTRTVFVLKDK